MTTESSVEARTVTDMLLRLADCHDRGPVFLDAELKARAWTYADVVQQSKRHAAFLQRNGVRAGDRIALLIVEAEDFMPAFFGTVLLGAIPVPLSLPVSMRALA